MKKISAITITTALLLATGCNQESGNAKAEQEIIFPKGEKITNDNFTGTTWLNNLIVSDSINPNAVGSVTKNLFRLPLQAGRMAQQNG